jgi:hypothetical protein
LDNPEKLTEGYAETAKLFDVTSETVRHICRNLRAKVQIPNEEEKFVITEQVLIRRENAEIKSLRRQLEQAIKEYQQLSDAYDIALNLKGSPVTDSVPSIDFEGGREEAAAIIQISDGHFGKIILPSTVNGLNSYNPDIAKKRMEVCAKNALSLIKKERADVKIKNLVLILGGDFLENSQLHHHKYYM